MPRMALLLVLMSVWGLTGCASTGPWQRPFAQRTPTENLPVVEAGVAPTANDEPGVVQLKGGAGNSVPSGQDPAVPSVNGQPGPGGIIAVSNSVATNPPPAMAPETRIVGTGLDLASLYGRTAMSDDRLRNPIIVIPGVLGSRLVDDQARRVVWGELGGNGVDPTSAAGAQLLAIPMEIEKPLEQLRDGVRVHGTLDKIDVRVFGVQFHVEAYRDILVALGVGGYRDPDGTLKNFHYGDQSYSCFQFAYDWRRDNVENAKKLHEFILEKKAYVEEERRKRWGEPVEPVRFDIVAHSMGGLIARYFLQYGTADLPEEGAAPEVTWAGAEHVERLVLVGTPNAGSLDSVEHLTRGVAFSQFLSKYEAALLGTMPALYQLLPRTRHRPIADQKDGRTVDVYDPMVWANRRWGLMDPNQQWVLKLLMPTVTDPAQRHYIAFDHLKKCLNRAKAFHAAMDVPTKPPEGTEIHLLAGDAHATNRQLWVGPRGELTVASKGLGDGIVTRSSALMDERYTEGTRWSPRLVSPIDWAGVTFLRSPHIALTSDPAFTDNVLYLLLESPR